MTICKRDALCTQCQALFDELEDEQLFAHYRHKLLVRGWAGVMSSVERAYVRKHRSEAQQQQAEQARARLKAHGFAPKYPSTATGTG